MIPVIFDNIIFSLQSAGGISAYWKELIERAVKDNALECSFLEYYKSGVNVFRKDLKPEKVLTLNNPEQSCYLRRYISPVYNFKAEHVFHSSYYRTSRIEKARNITTVHDFIYEKYFHGLPATVHHYQKKRALAGSEIIICVSGNTKKDLLNYFPEINENRVHVIYNGVSDHFRHVSGEKPQYISNLGEYAMYVGERRQAYKNFGQLVTALSSFKNINLVMAGGGALDRSEILMLDKHLSGRYHHFNLINNKELNLLYNYSFALVYPSVYEGFGIPVIEAQKAGCPVIATKGSSISEIAADSAILNEKGTADEIIVGLDKLGNANFRIGMVEKGYVNSSRFSWDKMANEVTGLYKTMI